MKNIIIVVVALLISATNIFGQEKLTKEEETKLYFEHLKKMFPGAIPTVVESKTIEVAITGKIAKKEQKNKREYTSLTTGKKHNRILQEGDTVLFYDNKPYFSYYNNAVIGNVIIEEKEKENDVVKNQTGNKAEKPKKPARAPRERRLMNPIVQHLIGVGVNMGVQYVETQTYRAIYRQ